MKYFNIFSLIEYQLQSAFHWPFSGWCPVKPFRVKVASGLSVEWIGGQFHDFGLVGWIWPLYDWYGYNFKWVILYFVLLNYNGTLMLPYFPRNHQSLRDVFTCWDKKMLQGEYVPEIEVQAPLPVERWWICARTYEYTTAGILKINLYIGCDVGQLKEQWTIKYLKLHR